MTLRNTHLYFWFFFALGQQRKVSWFVRTTQTLCGKALRGTLLACSDFTQKPKIALTAPLELSTPCFMC